MKHPIAIGYTTMTSKEMSTKNKGIGIELVSYIGDDTWLIK